MTSSLKRLVFAGSICIVSLATDVTGQTLHRMAYVGADVSGSNAILADPSFLERLDQYMDRELKNMKPRDRVVLQTFGGESNVHLLKDEWEISNRARPGKVRKEFRSKIREHAKQVGDRTSRIIAFLTNNSRSFECSQYQTSIILLSDGLENEEVNPSDVLAGKQALPQPKSALLKGCHIIMAGFGRTGNGMLSSSQIANLEEAWSKWAELAGATIEFRTNL